MLNPSASSKADGTATVNVATPNASVVEVMDALFTKEVIVVPSIAYDSVVVAFAATNVAS